MTWIKTLVHRPALVTVIYLILIFVWLLQL